MKPLINWNEEYLFRHLLMYYYPDLKPRLGKFTYDDCISKFNDSIVELKCRTTHYDKDGMMIEKTKYGNIMDIGALEHVRTILYINSTPQGIYRWNLTTLPTPIWKTRECNKRTQGINPKDIERIDKLVGYLQIEDAVCLDDEISLLRKVYTQSGMDIPPEKIMSIMSSKERLERIRKKHNGIHAAGKK